ncbi:hypothetical protein SBX64_16125 [Vibrio rhizosphaerae]|uniref:DUF2178 domain-containing protein n=1 Tax=Vibrio rhizosphaerae TaxID=398736 RepID=A0ABU4IXE0_9VIBR|nr:hypothetical protein [Vibrio rhizosphaerae]MDW6094067.1 hypothetical protein [Vibrio rhizosphaerae]
MPESKVDTVKANKRSFFIKEILIYIFQIYFFFWVAFLSSGALTSEDLLVKYLDNVINDRVLITLGFSFVALLITLGTLVILSKGWKKNESLEVIFDDVVASVPRTVYYFGSSICGTCLACALFRFFNPGDSSPQLWLYLSLSTGVLAFAYGYYISYWCNRASINSEEEPHQLS